MKKYDLRFILALLLSSFALLPLLRNAGLPHGYDVLYHVYRAAEMGRSWDAGIYMPRWAESFYFGYGYPVFHYYASACYYLTSLLSTLFGLNAVDALRAVIGLSFIGGGAGMYAFSQRRWGAIGGSLAAVVYVYSPYFLYTEPYTRGDYPELIALALAPWLFWAFDRLADSNQRPANLIIAVGLSTFLIITHNLMALVLTGLLAGWLVWLRLVGVTNWPVALRQFAALGLGVGLAAYFWLPVLIERDAVQLNNLISVAELDYRNFFTPARTLFGGAARADSGALNGLQSQYSLGVATWVLGLGGGLILIRRRGQTARSLAYFGGMAALMIVLTLPLSESIWQVVTPLAYLQFPWRFIGPSAFCLAILAAAHADWLQALPPRIGPIILGGLCLFPLVMAIPRLYVPQWDLDTVDTSVAAYQQAEVSGRQRGTTFSGEFLPIGVLALPSPTERLLADFADGRPIDHSHQEALPAGVQVEITDSNPHHHAWAVQADAPFTMEVLIFNFAGWQARVNGEPVPITTSTPHGFITFPVPAGQSTVTLSLENTPPRKLGYGVSLLAVVGTFGLAWMLHRQTIPQTRPDNCHDSFAWVGVIGAALIYALILALFFRAGVAWIASPAGEALAASHPVDYEFGQTFRLLGYDLSSREGKAGGRLDLTLYWYAKEPPQAGYASFVHITTGGPPDAQSDRQNPGGVPTLEWTTDGYMLDKHSISLPDGMPAGTYEIRVGLWTCDGLPEGQDCGNGLRLEVIEAQTGNSLGDTALLGKVNIR